MSVSVFSGIDGSRLDDIINRDDFWVSLTRCFNCSFVFLKLVYGGRSHKLAHFENNKKMSKRIEKGWNICNLNGKNKGIYIDHTLVYYYDGDSDDIWVFQSYIKKYTPRFRKINYFTFWSIINGNTEAFRLTNVRTNKGGHYSSFGNYNLGDLDIESIMKNNVVKNLDKYVIRCAGDDRFNHDFGRLFPRLKDPH